MPRQATYDWCVTKIFVLVLGRGVTPAVIKLQQMHVANAIRMDHAVIAKNSSFESHRLTAYIVNPLRRLSS